ncbi:Putative motility protein [Evansella caseinilytica]|uniref:Putative motility protein n=1 Tax=Evansella caseinilytica TaxID=1503961 RepID=A0A1H3S9G2_9BACI|nr:YjfB family protein [Evansella caseinilytica]SDZ33779.1 Putative motility protein [Evansella caseinilytica]
MDIGLLSMALSKSQVQQQASMLIMKKAMGQAEQHNEVLLKLMGAVDTAALEHAAQPHLGGNIDLKL